MLHTNTVFDGNNAWADYNEAGEAIARYLFGDSIDSNIARWRAGEGTAWYLTDHLGTVRAIADAVGMLVNQTTYDSFGQVLNETNPFFGDRYKFTGRELNSGGDYFYRARTYNASQGRFGSQDPIRFAAADADLYRYVDNSPNAATDPSGEVVVLTVAVSLFVVAPSLVVIGCDDGVLGGLGIFSENRLCNAVNFPLRRIFRQASIDIQLPRSSSYFMD